MKALCLLSPGKVELVEAPIPAVHDDWLLVRTGAATICTSDIHDIHSNPFDIPLPVTIGHEAAGTVEAVGPAVKKFRPGERIATHPVHPCGVCQACQDGTPHLCLRMQHFGINLPGTMAEYYLVREDRALPIPEELGFPLASLAEPLSVCLEALAQARLQAGGSLAILGDGPFGVMMAHLAQRVGLKQLLLVGQQDFRLSFAERANRLNTAGESDPAAAILQTNQDKGFDACILAVSSAAAFAQCLSCLKPKGRLVVFSALPSDTPVDLFSVHIKELEIIGACNDQDRFAQAVQLLSNPSLDLAKLITHRFLLEDFQQALHLAAHGQDQAMKVTFEF